MFQAFRSDWRAFTEPCNTRLDKVRRVCANPGMKMVLMHRLINEMPSPLAPLGVVCKLLYHRMTFKYGIDLPLALGFGRNLRIFHFGAIVINPRTVIGNDVVIMHQVTLGNTMKDDACPVISDRCFLGVGAKVLGGVFLAEGIRVGANAVVTRSCHVQEATLVGIPARPLGKDKHREGTQECVELPAF